jgi:hypothetical protein
MPLRLDSSPDTSPDSLGKDNADNPRQQQQQQQQERRTAANGLAAGFQALLRVSTAAAGGSFDSARGAAAPAGEVEMQTGGVDEGSLKLASVAEAAAAAMVGEDVEGTQGMHGRPVPTKVCSLRVMLSEMHWSQEVALMLLVHSICRAWSAVAAGRCCWA